MKNIEKIRAEVKRRKDELRYLPFTDENLGKINAYEFVLKIIDSLPEEPVSEDLEEAAKQNQIKYVFDNNVKEIILAELKYIGVSNFKDGANWYKEQMIDKACEWLEGFMEYSNLFEYQVSESEQKKVIIDFRKAMEAEK